MFQLELFIFWSKSKQFFLENLVFLTRQSKNNLVIELHVKKGSPKMHSVVYYSLFNFSKKINVAVNQLLETRSNDFLGKYQLIYFFQYANWFFKTII